MCDEEDYCEIRTVSLLPALSAPPSTLSVDLSKMCGDPSLPQGLVSFVVGVDQQRIEHISKSLLAVRSEHFSVIFRTVRTQTPLLWKTVAPLPSKP